MSLFDLPNFTDSPSNDDPFTPDAEDGGGTPNDSEPNDVGPSPTEVAGVATANNDNTDTSIQTETRTAAEITVVQSETPLSTETDMIQPTLSITSVSDNDTQSDNDNGGGGGMSNSTKIAIAVPIAVVGAAIIAVILFFLLRRRRRQRNLNSQPVISTPQMDNTSSVFLPQQQPPIQPVPLAAAAPIARRPVPQGPYVEPVEPASAETNHVVAAGATRDLEWRTSEERGGRPRSPFDHPHDNDDNLSIVSGISDREAMMRARGPRDDDVSSVSSFEDEPRPSTTNRGG
ncbi:hypothetical protein BJX63DRAFT_214064 [Aspergillus granulosus]|uniref:Mid2 domain-containing protein n=1 Tax=Aspergillus granulosus TaxID=176169 RepID=A0ABR4HEJ6_9EURO